MSSRRKEHPVEQFADEKAGLVVAVIVGFAFIAGLALIVSGLSG